LAFPFVCVGLDPASALALAPDPPSRFVFVGDVLLARGVVQERNGRGVSPWREWRPFFAGVDWVMGNLEGSVGPSSECSPVPGPCFAIPDSLIADARAAGFTALSLANNHAADLGTQGHLRTRSALLRHGLVPVGFGDSPVFRLVGGRVIAFVALSLVPGKDGRAQSLPGLEEARKLRFARAFAERVVVFVHWGGELRDWAEAGQIEGARWLASRGADLILGAHPHVVQPAVCVAGVPVFYSLGNHLFDQKYPETRRGLAADCLLDQAGFACRALPTAVSPDGFFPRPPDTGAGKAAPLLRCADSAGARGLPLAQVVTTWKQDSIKLGWTRTGADGKPIHWSTSASGLLCAAPFRLRGDSGAYLFTVERHYSNLDGENAPRPYVYFLGSRGPVAKWRGSGLAWPLLDAVPLPAEPGVLCALHRGDSFLIPDPAAPANRIAAYRWNGFGFSMAKDAELETACSAELQGLL
jgi:poly-gamma-glutamate synthesis protein (capsule biosynthesis protein)